MADNSLFSKIPKSQKKVTEDILDLVLERILKNFYLQLDAEGKQKMEKVFLSGDKKLKEDFINRAFPDPAFVFRQELANLMEEIKAKVK